MHQTTLPSFPATASCAFPLPPHPPNQLWTHLVVGDLFNRQVFTFGCDLKQLCAN